MEGHNRPMFLVARDRTEADAISDTVEKLIGERPQSRKAIILTHLAVSQAEGDAILALVRSGVTLPYRCAKTVHWFVNTWAKSAALYFHRFKDNSDDPELLRFPYDAILHNESPARVATIVDDVPPVRNGQRASQKRRTL